MQGIAFNENLTLLCLIPTVYFGSLHYVVTRMETPFSYPCLHGVAPRSWEPICLFPATLTTLYILITNLDKFF